MLKSVGDIYAILLGWPAAARLNEAFLYLSSRALGFHNYSSPSISGETRIVNERVPRNGAPVVFDVGANNGDWSALVLNANKLAKIHAFEPQPALAATWPLASPPENSIFTTMWTIPAHNMQACSRA